MEGFLKTSRERDIAAGTLRQRDRDRDRNRNRDSSEWIFMKQLPVQQTPPGKQKAGSDCNIQRGNSNRMKKIKLILIIQVSSNIFFFVQITEVGIDPSFR